MSLRDKYTKKEWSELEKIVFKKIDNTSYDGQEGNKFIGDEFGTIGKLGGKNRYDNLDYYDSVKKPLTHEDEVNPLGKVNLWDFSGGMNKDTDFTQIESGDYKFADNISVEEILKFNKLEDNLTKEYQKIKGLDIIDSIIHKVYEKIANGKCPEVTILSENDYHDLGIVSYFNLDLDYITVMGCKLKIHVSQKAKDGDVEIY